MRCPRLKNHTDLKLTIKAGQAISTAILVLNIYVIPGEKVCLKVK